LASTTYLILQGSTGVDSAESFKEILVGKGHISFVLFDVACK
jgi:hypothetical protein